MTELNKEDIIGEEYTEELRKRIEESDLRIGALLVSTDGEVMDTISGTECDLRTDWYAKNPDWMEKAEKGE